MVYINEICGKLKNNGYEIANSNVPVVKFAIKKETEKNHINIICILDTQQVTLRCEDIDNIVFQIERKMILSERMDVETIVWIISDDTEKDKLYNNGKFKYWIVDAALNRVMVYENQPDDFDGLKKDLENVCDLAYAKENSEGKVTKVIGKIPIVTTIIILVNVIVYIILSCNGNVANPVYMLANGALFYGSVFDKHEYYRLITSMFMHFGIDHLLLNMTALFFAGNEVEKYYGRLNFLFIYFFSGITGGLLSIIMYCHMGNRAVCAGASGAIYGLIGALVVRILQTRSSSRDMIRKIVIIILMIAIIAEGKENVDSIAHLGGFLGGMISGLICFVTTKIVYYKKRKITENKNSV